jgi:malonyl-CoA/methylmalonyl-CoA synthetase
MPAASLFDHIAAAHGGAPDRILLEDGSGTGWSYALADGQSARLARRLGELGCRPGDRILLQAATCPAWLWVYLACLRAGYVIVPVSADYTGAELRYFLQDAEPAVALADGARLAQLRAAAAGLPVHVESLEALDAAASAGAPAVAPPVAGDRDLAALLYSSGTTGRPKGARLSHANLVANALTLAEAWGFSPADRLLHALPLHHAHGLFVAVGTALVAGASILLRPKFDAADIVAQLPGCTVFMGVPTHYTRLLAEPGLTPEACRNVRLFVSGSAPLGAALHARFAAATGHRILERYGMTETLMLTSNPLHGERRPGTVGRPLAGVDVRIGDGSGTSLASGTTGEVEVRGPSVMDGYWRQPAQSAAALTPDGWFRTGDLGQFSADGYLTIVGRSKDLIITGGLNVYPREVELVLDALPGVAESAVIGVPHPDFGEAVVAVVVPATEPAPSADALLAAARRQLAGYKTPKRVFFAPALPRNALGKVRKAELRERYRDAFAGGEPSTATASRPA